MNSPREMPKGRGAPLKYISMLNGSDMLGEIIMKFQLISEIQSGENS